jgi:hypothetical protein
MISHEFEDEVNALYVRMKKGKISSTETLGG